MMLGQRFVYLVGGMTGAYQRGRLDIAFQAELHDPPLQVA